MNHKKKITMLGAAFAIAVIALAGVGYAVTGNYTARTDSATSSYDVDWVVLKLDEDAYTSPSNIRVVWNEVTTYTNSAYNYAFDFIVADVIEHELTIVSTAADSDELSLTATVSFSSNIYTLKYSTDGTNYTTYDQNCALVTGMDVTGESSLTIYWTVEAADQATNSVVDYPGSTVNIPAIVYLIEATNVSQ